MMVKLPPDKSASESVEDDNRSMANVASSAAKPIYTCPMHPEIQQDHPGNCPKCGMTLEPKTVTTGTDEAENADLRDMTRR
jgi:Cu+-exporting ATPase